MQIRELSKPVTSKQLNESLARSFGYKLNLEQFSNMQLADVQNKLRTEVSQFEVNEGFDQLHSNAKYQKTRALLDVINQAMLERDESGEDKVDVEEPTKAEKKTEKKKEKKNESFYFSRVRAKAQEHSVPHGWIESAIGRMTLGESDQEELSAELQLRYDLNESQASHILYLAEGEAEKAEIIMATKDMVDRITGWLEDTAAMKAEQLLELVDSITKEPTLGSDVAQQYNDTVKPALEAVYTALETSRKGLTGALATVSGEQAPTMGAPVDGAMGADLGGEMGTGAEAELGAGGLPAEETPPAPEMGREKRESVDYSRRLGILLASKKN